VRRLVTALSLLSAAVPIPGGVGGTSAAPFSGKPAVPHPVVAPDPPRHPHMAANGRSNLHEDAYQTDTHQDPGVLGNGTVTTSAQNNGECASITFDSKDRIVSACVGAAGPTLQMIDPKTLERLALFALPPRNPMSGNPTSIFQNFSGGGYFYLDDKDRAVIPTTSRHLYIVAETPAPGFTLERDFDLTGAVPSDDAIISALPDWSGRLWFASRNGVMGWVDPASGKVFSRDTKEPIGNSFAIDEEDGVYVVTDGAQYRFEAGPDGPVVVWRQTYDNIGSIKPGQTQAGSGTTPTLIGRNLLAITDNADPMQVVIMRRDRTVSGDRVTCKQPVFQKGASDTDQSLIGIPGSIVVENNYGYSGPVATEQGKTTTPGLQRIDFDADGRNCHIVWTSNEIAPSVVPKLSLGAGLVYAYTKPADADGNDFWNLAALDFDTGQTVFKVLSGEGLGYNNNYAPVTIAPDGAIFVGTLGGLTSFRDKVPPTVPPAAGAKPRVRVSVRQRCAGRARVRVRVLASGLRRMEAFRGGKRVRTDRKAPFTATLRGRKGTLRIRATLRDGRRVSVTRKLRRCR
jgi:hypothetical protein